MPKLPLIAKTVRDLSSLQDHARGASKSPWDQGNLLEDVELVSTATKRLSHGLKRPYRGFLVAGLEASSAPGVVYAQKSNSVKDREIWLTISSGSATVNIWVY